MKTTEIPKLPTADGGLKPKQGFRRIKRKDRTSGDWCYGYFHGWHKTYIIRSATRDIETVALIEDNTGLVESYDLLSYEFVFIDLN